MSTAFVVHEIRVSPDVFVEQTPMVRLDLDLGDGSCAAYLLPLEIARGLRSFLPRGETPDAGAPPSAAPVPMLLWCPGCGERHIDKGDFATKSHHTHSCQTCGMTWRPGVLPTVGVQFLPGFKDEAGERA